MHGTLPKILEKIVSAETLLTWTKGDRESTNERRLSDNQNSTGRKQVDKTTQPQTCTNFFDKIGGKPRTKRAELKVKENYC